VRGNEGEDDVEVVDHEVENHVDIEGAGREDAEAMRLKEHGAGEARLDGEDGGVEALEMAGLENAVFFFGPADEVVGLSKAGGEGFFDEQVEAGLEQGGGDGVVMDGGYGHAGGLGVEIGREQFADAWKDGNGKLRSGFPGTGGVGFDGGNEGRAETGCLQLAQHAEMIAAEDAGSGDDHAYGMMSQVARDGGAAVVAHGTILTRGSLSGPGRP
jgi:hypothetical protein